MCPAPPTSKAYFVKWKHPHVPEDPVACPSTVAPWVPPSLGWGGLEAPPQGTLQRKLLVAAAPHGPRGKLEWLLLLFPPLSGSQWEPRASSLAACSFKHTQAPPSPDKCLRSQGARARLHLLEGRAGCWCHCTPQVSVCVSDKWPAPR